MLRLSLLIAVSFWVNVHAQVDEKTPATSLPEGTVLHLKAPLNILPNTEFTWFRPQKSETSIPTNVRCCLKIAPSSKDRLLPETLKLTLSQAKRILTKSGDAAKLFTKTPKDMELIFYCGLVSEGRFREGATVGDLGHVFSITLPEPEVIE